MSGDDNKKPPPLPPPLVKKDDEADLQRLARLEEAQREIEDLEDKTSSTLSRNPSRESVVEEDPWAPQRDPRYQNKDGSKTSRGKARAFLDSTPMTILMIFCTLWALFATDINVLILPKAADKAIYGILFFTFIVFSLEIPVELWVQGIPYLEFYFWLDLFTTLSLLPDVIALFNPGFTKSPVLDILTLARAGRAARASSRASRIIRFIKVLNSGNRVKKNKKIKKEDLDFEIEEGEEVTLTQSLVGIKFTEATTRRVVFIVILVLIMLSLLDLIVPSDWVTAQTGVAGAVVQLASFHRQIVVLGNDPALFRTQGLDPFLLQFSDSAFIQLNNVVAFEELPRAEIEKKYRISDYVEILGCGFDPSESYKLGDPCASPKISYDLLFKIKSYNQKSSGSNILLVALIVIILAIGNFAFIIKADKLVISPVERMTRIVKHLAKNPLVQIKERRKAMHGESGVVLNMLLKLIGLVQTGFGEAGSAIIAANMGEGGTVDVMKPGRKMRAIFGFCDIRNFTDMTEILNEDCMFLVNSIADILHGNVHSRLGSANKNIGDAFLLVWRLHEAQVGKKFTPEATVAANALNSFLVTAKEMSESKTLQAIGKRTPMYAPIKMGYGLHVGWAIEGAVGSTYKIDATYLSPHVNMSSRLESLTKSYGATILMSGEFVALLPQNWHKRVRLVDIITVKGSSVPLEIYVIDDLTPITNDLVLYPPDPNAANPLIAHRQLHLDGITAFKKGNWKSAVAHFTEFHAKTGDPPTQLLLNWMKDKATPKGDPPADFEGFRRLTEK